VLHDHIAAARFFAMSSIARATSSAQAKGSQHRHQSSRFSLREISFAIDDKLKLTVSAVAPTISVARISR
jgi:hypothetical protein